MTDYERLVATASQCGLKIISDDLCCKVLAWLYVMGGGYEVGHNSKLLSDIRYAQKQLNICGGEIPNPELCETLRARIKELESSRQDCRPEWLYELQKRYSLPNYAIDNYIR